MGAFVVPPALRPGDRIRVVAPASPFDRTLFFRGVGWLAERYAVELGEHVLRRSGFLAGTDRERLADLNDALRDPQVKAIVAARGGHGCVRIAHTADWATFARAPKWIVGFSDITLLHCEALRVGVCSLHAENAAGLGRGDEHARQAWFHALEQPTRARSFEGLFAFHPGSAAGTLVGGNLTMLFTALASGRLRLPAGAILALEDVTEASYRIDRMLSAMLMSGVLDQVAAVVLGDFTDCPAGQHGVDVESVLIERLSVLGVPVLGGAPFGHGYPNRALTFGLRARVDGARGTFTLALDD